LVVGSTPTRPATFTLDHHHHMFSFLGRLRQFWNETITEVFVKAPWPTLKELADSTLVVIVVVALLGAVVFLCDFSLSNFVQFATHLVR
jgi:preprotein translocase SecE subunit